MPRKPRMYMAGVPAHIVQRGNNRNACFFTDDDYRIYKEWLGDACKRYGVELYAYVLMTNHVHRVLLAPERKEGISLAIQSVGRRYVQYVNKTYRRTGTLWESRHKSSLVQAEEYLLTCYRYIELNPVRAGMDGTSCRLSLVQLPTSRLWRARLFGIFSSFVPFLGKW